MYAATQDAPHLVHCVSQPQLTRHGDYIVELQPLGYHCNPRDEAELKDAVMAVLHALSSLHEHGYAHRDVRWVNVMRDEKVRMRGERYCAASKHSYALNAARTVVPADWVSFSCHKGDAGACASVLYL